MKTLQPYPRPETMIPWIKWHLRNQRDVMVEFRGPKGFGKSALMFHLIRKLQWDLDYRAALCYNHKQYVTVAKRIRRVRKSEDAQGKPRSLQLIWMDDATRLANRRDHMTRKNKRFLDVMRTSRDALQAVQFIGTQDDFVERPMMELGPYVVVLFRKPYEPILCWPKQDAMMTQAPIWVPMKQWPWHFPKPEDAYGEDWGSYQKRRRELTESLHAQAMKALDARTQDPSTEEWAALRAQGLPLTMIAERFGVSHQAVVQRLQRREKNLLT